MKFLVLFAIFSTFVAATTQVAECPSGYFQVGTLSSNNDIAGKALGQTQQPNIDACKSHCESNSQCVAFMYGGKNLNQQTKCELSETKTPDYSWGTNFRFCAKRQFERLTSGGTCENGGHMSLRTKSECDIAINVEMSSSTDSIEISNPNKPQYCSQDASSGSYYFNTHNDGANIDCAFPYICFCSQSYTWELKSDVNELCTADNTPTTTEECSDASAYFNNENIQASSGQNVFYFNFALQSQPLTGCLVHKVSGVCFFNQATANPPTLVVNAWQNICRVYPTSESAESEVGKIGAFTEMKEGQKQFYAAGVIGILAMGFAGLYNLHKRKSKKMDENLQLLENEDEL